MMQNRKVELLAPAGDFTCFMAAMNAGADAVYLGGNRFGARAYANNFTEEEIIEALKIAHLLGKRIYLTVNTLVKEREMQELVPYLQPLYDAGLDGVIIQDLGVFQVLKRQFPGLELHASTQMTITGVYGAKLLKELGACRIVPARELSLEELRDIKEQTGLEIETFIHGAMCYGYSGQCLLSSILGGRSGNRGRCAGPCRLPYKDAKGKTIYPLSLNDMYTLPLIPQLIETGIDSFKIEGRMKSPEYVAGVTAMYRKYIDLYLEHPEKPFKISQEDEKVLRGLYIRSDTCTGYYTQHNHRSMVTIKEPGYSGCSEEVLQNIRNQYLNVKKTIPIQGVIRISKDAPSELELTYQDISVRVTGETVSAAMNRPLTEEDICNKVCKLGDTSFCMTKLVVETDNASFMPVKALNELRRQACNALEEAILQPYQRTASENAEAEQVSDSDVEQRQESNSDSMQQCQESTSERLQQRQASGQRLLYVSISTYEQVKTVLLTDSNTRISGLYLSSDLLFEQDYARVLALMQEYPQMRYYLAMPNIVRKRSYKYLNEIEAILKKPMFQGVLIRNTETLQWLKEISYEGEYLADYSVYAWNQETMALYSQLFDRCTIPVELNKKEIYALGNQKACEMVLYGRLPLMYSANCVRKTLEHCENSTASKPELYYLTDRYRNRFPILQNCLHCYNILYNTVPMSLHGQLSTLMNRNCAVYRLEFTLENGKETKEILEYYLDAMTAYEENTEVKKDFPLTNFTNGHYKRGVE